MSFINVHELDKDLKKDMKNKKSFTYEKELSELLKTISIEFYMYLNTTTEYFGISNEDYHEFWDVDGCKNKEIQRHLMKLIKKCVKESTQLEGDKT